MIHKKWKKRIPPFSKHKRFYLSLGLIFAGYVIFGTWQTHDFVQSFIEIYFMFGISFILVFGLQSLSKLGEWLDEFEEEELRKEEEKNMENIKQSHQTQKEHVYLTD